MVEVDAVKSQDVRKVLLLNQIGVLLMEVENGVKN
jgi:hypothetical protein